MTLIKVEYVQLETFTFAMRFGKIPEHQHEKGDKVINAMFNPPHPGEVLREDIIKPLGLSLFTVSHLLGISHESLFRIINGQGDITPQIAIRLEMAFKPSADSWLRHQAAYDQWRGRA